jgi:hypothetical protein
MHLLAPLLLPLAAWAENSQRIACRNAMTASTELAERLRESRDVQEYVVRTLELRASAEEPAASRSRAG